MEKRKTKMSVRDLTFIGISVALITIMAQLTVPLPVVPLTMQTFAVPLVGAALGAKKGAIAALVYVLLGAVGAPVFAGFGGGFHRIIGPWGGYLLSYPIFAFVAGFGADKGKNNWLGLGLVVGSIINLTMGTIQLGLVNNLMVWDAFIRGFAQFIPAEIIKLTLVFFITPDIRKAIAKIGNNG